MAPTVAPNSIASLGGQINTLLGQLPAGTLTGGGATAAVTPGGTAAPAAAGAAATGPISGQVKAVSGRTVTVMKDEKGAYSLTPGSGFDEIAAFDGKTLRFDPTGKQTRSFEIAERQNVKVDLDQRAGIATGITNLSKIVAERQEKLKRMQDALAVDVNDIGGTNQLDIQKLVTEQQATEHLSNMNHKIYESVQNAISPWLR